MREILFRGKRFDNGEWVEGYYSASPAGNHYITYVCAGCAHPDKVDPETVGQYTGLTDKNGVKIFEWDIIRHKTYLEERIYCILYDEGAFCYFYDRNAYPLTDYKFGLYCENVEVIGNIFDQHCKIELLKEGGVK